ncbi:hypothetical protein CCM_06400 [Cordyceps militaris CM01]|uniref:Uncharacterized protein n=1 Tax=Cordyceps militaris (strain CM01) TaxID=983644 RepID=G3JKG1_CORMM|nr:uncharacterized protein CCM_06400 [Cordyceps militaris CM01]EGX92239.1 hypothetical protein CCM_06400 [Cordyceps militaris CM01]
MKGVVSVFIVKIEAKADLSRWLAAGQEDSQFHENCAQADDSPASAPVPRAGLEPLCGSALPK